VERVVKDVLMCFWNRDPIVSLDPVVLGPIAETEQATRCNI
jgi:hypothetical protein